MQKVIGTSESDWQSQRPLYLSCRIGSISITPLALLRPRCHLCHWSKSEKPAPPAPGCRKASYRGSFQGSYPGKYGLQSASIVPLLSCSTWKIEARGSPVLLCRLYTRLPRIGPGQDHRLSPNWGSNLRGWLPSSSLKHTRTKVTHLCASTTRFPSGFGIELYA